ncbi:glycosyltransferase family 4 protein [Kocuria sp. M4R2S49]|uniref:glycosyltransferase family 4 protein n=1 Tax=Kocuria rhizosphaericola TaxID=3376284 RepID=UPI0037B438F0
MMKILQVLLSPRIGGAESLAMGLEKQWANMGVQSSITYLDSSDEQKSSRLQRIRHLRSEFRRYSPDIVLSHSAIPNAYCRAFLPRTATVIPVLHNSADDYKSRTLRYAEHYSLRGRTTPIVAVSEVAKNTYSKWFGFDVDLPIIRNGVDDPGFAPPRTLRPTEVVTLARVTPAKNPELWVNVVEFFRSNSDLVNFDWIGPIENNPQMKAAVSRVAPWENSCAFKGSIPNGASRLKKYHLYFHPADKEALGISVVEAIMTGLPVICSKSVASVVGGDLVAETFEPGNSESAHDAITRALNNFSFHIAASQARRDSALQQFGIHACAMAYIDLFKSIAPR